MDIGSPYKELRAGDTLDFAVLWGDELDGDTLASSTWTVPTGLALVADDRNTSGPQTIDGVEYAQNTVATAWLRVDPAADPQPAVGDVLEVVNTATKTNDNLYTRNAKLYIVIVDEYS